VEKKKYLRTDLKKWLSPKMEILRHWRRKLKTRRVKEVQPFMSMKCKNLYCENGYITKNNLQIQCKVDQIQVIFLLFLLSTEFRLGFVLVCPNFWASWKVILVRSIHHSLGYCLIFTSVITKDSFVVDFKPSVLSNRTHGVLSLFEFVMICFVSHYVVYFREAYSVFVCNNL